MNPSGCAGVVGMVLLLVATCHQRASWALPGGAPSLACSSMTPYHFAFQPQPLAESPFRVRQSRVVYQPNSNDTIAVTLQVDRKQAPHRAFRGFLVKAFNPISNRAIGQFREDFSVALRPNCHAATHHEPHNKQRVVLHWTPEDVTEEDVNLVVFEATFVESFRKFYVSVPSTHQGRPARQQIEKALKKRHQATKTARLDDAELLHHAFNDDGVGEEEEEPEQNIHIKKDNNKDDTESGNEIQPNKQTQDDKDQKDDNKNQKDQKDEGAKESESSSTFWF